MRAGQYSARLSGPRHLCEGVQEGPGLRYGGGLLKGLADGLVGAEPLEVPGVELAQIAPGAGAAEVLDGAVHDHSSSCRTSAAVGSLVSRAPRSWANSHGLPSAPRASMTAAAPVRSYALRTASGPDMPPVRITGASRLSTRRAARS